jgi:hypothetical protein
VANGWNDHIIAGDGNDVIHGNHGGAEIDAGLGNNSITIAEFNNHVVASDGDNSLTGGAGQAVVQFGNGAQSITLGGSNNDITIGNTTAGKHSSITAGDGNESVHAGNGDVGITLGGYNNLVVAGSGNHSVQGALGNSTVQLGAGSNTVDLGGYGNHISVAGNSSVHAGAGNASITIAGSAELWLNGWGNKVDGSHASDLTIHAGQGNGLYIAPAAGSGVEHIIGFNANAGDQVQLRSADQGHVTFQLSGADLDILVNGVEVVELKGVAGVSGQSLLDHHSIIFG